MTTKETPSPDIAGLVDRLRLWAQWETRRKAPRPQTARPDDLYKAATALQRVAQERDEARLQQKAWADKWDYDTSAAEARIATARDEGLEIAAKVADGFFEGPGVAAAIRALKGK